MTSNRGLDFAQFIPGRGAWYLLAALSGAIALYFITHTRRR